MSALFRNRFGIPGAISVIALVFALIGGAYAANDAGDGQATASQNKRGLQGLNAKQKREVRNLARNIAKRFRGPAGPVGPVGLPGANGLDGAPGQNGQPGTSGQPGTNGKSVEVGGSAPGCAEGGVTVQVEDEPATAREVCNGEEGEQGPEGEPWNVGGAPSGALLKGTWAISSNAAGAGEQVFGSISTGVPLGDPILIALRRLQGGPPAELGPVICPGTDTDPLPAEGIATGDPFNGVLCIYTHVEVNVNAGQVAEGLASGGGTYMRFTATAAGPVRAFGTWAMYAP